MVQAWGETRRLRTMCSAIDRRIGVSGIREPGKVGGAGTAAGGTVRAPAVLPASRTSRMSRSVIRPSKPVPLT
jgi:hypothetical protein